MLELHSRGIITYNYDHAHENAIKELGRDLEWGEPLHPKDNDLLLYALRDNLSKPFLLKAHGSQNDPESIVLSRESCRNLYHQFPAHKAFMQNIFTNFQLLIVGFGLSDPEFNGMIENSFNMFGSPLQKHVVVKHRKNATPRDELFRLRFGLHFLYVEEHDHLYSILVDCLHEISPHIQEIVNACMYVANVAKDKTEARTIRSEAHAKIRELNEPGKRALSAQLKTKIIHLIAKEQMKGYSENTELSKYVYTLGQVDVKNRESKEFLIKEVVEKSVYVEPIAHALVTLTSALEESDIPRIDGWIERINNTELLVDDKNPDPDKRLIIYAECLKAFLRAKHEAWDPKS